jgi:KaiC/GvpD/RAD55 family RecA-like ATPase
VFDVLRGIAENVKILPLPGDRKDVSDWIAAGGTREKLESLVATMTSPTPEEPEEKTAITKPPLFDDVGRTLRAGRIPAPIWLVKGLIERGLILLFGPSGAGKSFIAMYLAFCVAAGGDFFGRNVERGPVIYICGEGRSGAYRRLAALAAHYRVKIPDESLFLSRRAVNLDLGSVAPLQEDIHAAISATGRPPVLLVIDTLARSLVGDENTQKDMAEFVSAVDKICSEFGCTSLIIHHTGHAEDSLKRARGSSVLPAAADSIIRCADRMLTWTKTKDAEPPGHIPFALEKISIGKDEDGGEISSAVIVEAGERMAPRTSLIGLKDADRLAMETLVKMSAKGEFRAGLYWVGLDEWRAEFVRFHWGDNKKSKYTAHLRSREKLNKMGLISVDNNYFAVVCPEDLEKVLDLVMIGPLLENAATIAMSESGPVTL